MRKYPGNNTTKSRALSLAIGILTCLITVSGQLPDQYEIKETLFKTPPDQFYPMPFWHINGELTEEGIRSQMEDAKYKAGFSGVAILPVGKTQPEFLSDAFFAKYQYILEMADNLDMKVILYDDTGFPSGTAGGLLEQRYPDDIRKVIDKYEVIRTGPSFWKMPVPCGEQMAAVAMNTETHERIDLSASIDGDILSWKVPDGTWKIMFFLLNKAPFWKSYFPVDYLDTSAIKRYMSLTYEEFARQFSPHFGTTIKLTFFDDVGFLRTERTWTRSFNEKFMDLYGYKPDLLYPALWYDIGPETEAARVALFNTRSELMAEGYPRMVTRWTSRHGLKNTGHPPGNYGIQPVDMHGDIFKFYRYTDIPLTDLIIDYGRGRDGFKLISSASDYYDRTVTATEIYGALSEEIVDSLMLYRALMEILARGVNFVVPHGMWYDPETVGIPPLISPFSKKLARGLPLYSDYAGRNCYMLQGGRRVADIAVLYPISSLQAGFYFDSPENKRAGTWAYPEADYLEVSRMLTNEIRRDFTFVHPEFLTSDKYAVRGDKLHLDNENNYQDYRLLILPGGDVISLASLRKIKAFYDSGGKVIATTLLPSTSAEPGQDEEIHTIVNEIFGPDPASYHVVHTGLNGGKAVFVPELTIEALRANIELLLPDGDVLFPEDPQIKGDLGLFSCIHKVREGRDIYFFANSSDELIDTEVLLRGKHRLEWWDPHSGATAKGKGISYESLNGQTYTRCRLQLEGVCSVFWISK